MMMMRKTSLYLSLIKPSSVLEMLVGITRCHNAIKEIGAHPNENRLHQMYIPNGRKKSQIFIRRKVLLTCNPAYSFTSKCATGIYTYIVFHVAILVFPLVLCYFFYVSSSSFFTFDSLSLTRCSFSGLVRSVNSRNSYEFVHGSQNFLPHSFDAALLV